MKKHNNYWVYFLRFLPAVMWMVVIFLFSSQQKLSVSESHWLNFFFFKALHICEYGILAIALQYGFRGKAFLSVASYSAWGYTTVLVIIYATIDELHQTFVPTREGSPRDVIIDILGLNITIMIFSKIRPKIVHLSRSRQ